MKISRRSLNVIVSAGGKRRPTRTPAETASVPEVAPHRSAQRCVASCGTPGLCESGGAVREHRDDAAETADIEYFSYRRLQRTYRKRKAGTLRGARCQQEYAQTGAGDIVEPCTVDDHAGRLGAGANQHLLELGLKAGGCAD
jgi:hypothetical protein